MGSLLLTITSQFRTSPLPLLSIRRRAFLFCGRNPKTSVLGWLSKREEILDSPGRDTGLSRKKYWTLQEEILDSPGRNTGLSRKKYWTLQEEILDSPGRMVLISPAKQVILERRTCVPAYVLLYCSCVNNIGLETARGGDVAGRQALPELGAPSSEEHFVKAESNLEEYPFFAIKRRNRKLEPRVFERTIEGENGALLRQQWTVMPSAGYGTPGPLDQDVYLAVLELLERKGGMPANGKLRFSLYELVELLGWSRSGKSGGKVYRDVRNSLERIGATRVKSENAFYSKERDSYISDSFNIWSVHLVSDR